MLRYLSYITQRLSAKWIISRLRCPKGKLRDWVTDGSTDSNKYAITYPNVTVLFPPSAEEDGRPEIRQCHLLSYTIFTDANTMLTESIKEIMTCFTQNGCGWEKRIENKDKDNAVSGGGLPRYESKLKRGIPIVLAVGAAGNCRHPQFELFNPCPQPEIDDLFSLQLPCKVIKLRQGLRHWIRLHGYARRTKRTAGGHNLSLG